MPADVNATASVRLTVDHEWYLVSSDKTEQEWLKADITHGVSTKNKKITFTALEEGLAETRTAKFKIVSGANSKKFTVTQGRKTLILTEDEVEDFDKYYKPLEFDFDMLRSDSKWSWCRSKQTEHVVVFWDKQYGEYGLYGDRMGVENTSPSTCSSSKMKVDIDDLLAKAEQFYKINTETLKFSEPGTGKSVLSRMEGREDRSARFVCALALKLPGRETLIAEGACPGVILYRRRGTGGFGYDPLFLYEPMNKTYAEMNAEEKNAVSHRARAREKMRQIMAEIAGQEN